MRINIVILKIKTGPIKQYHLYLNYVNIKIRLKFKIVEFLLIMWYPF